jgi:hypothetical protein
MGLLLLMSFLPAGEAAAASSQYIIDAFAQDGGDCAVIGVWDQATATCTLTSDLAATGTDILITLTASASLDGGGHTLSGYNSTGTGVSVTGFGSSSQTAPDSYEITGLTITEFSTGIYFDNVYNSSIYGNRFIANGTGIDLSGHIFYSPIECRQFPELQSTPYCQENSFKYYSEANVVYGNDFMGDTAADIHALVDPDTSPPERNSFNLPLPAGGNHFNGYDEASEGCNDGNGNGFCDGPVVFSGGQDDLPLTKPNCSASDPGLELSLLQGAYWESMADYHDGILSIDYGVIGPIALNHARLDVVGTINSNGVGTHQLPEYSTSWSAGGRSFIIKYSVPDGTQSFANTVFATVEDSCGGGFAYPGPWPGP